MISWLSEQVASTENKYEFDLAWEALILKGEPQEWFNDSYRLKWKGSGLSVGLTCGSNIIQSSLNLPDKKVQMTIDIKVS